MIKNNNFSTGIKKIAGCFFSLLLFKVSYTQKDTSAIMLDSLVVTAQRTLQHKIDVPYAVTSIDNNFFSLYQPRTTPEALTGLNGVFVQKTNHGGGSPFIRGFTGNQVLFLIDGIRMNNSTYRYGPNQYLNTIDAYSINRIEVAKGTGSVQYGTDALGGVIHAFTKVPTFSNERKFEGQGIVKYMYGDMEKTARANVGYSEEKFGFIGGVTIRNFDDLIGGDTTGKQSPSGYNEWAYDLKLKWQLQENAELILAQQFLKQTSVPVYHKIQLENFLINEMDPQQRTLSYARLKLKGAHRFWKETNITASHQKSLEGRNTQKNGSDILRREEDIVNTVGLTLDVLSRFNSFWTANSGIEVYSDKILSERLDVNQQNFNTTHQRGLSPDNSIYKNYSVYTLNHFNYNKWVFDVGGRYNIFSISIKDTSLGIVQLKPSAFVGNAAVMYKLLLNHHLYFSYSSGFRAPNVDDLGTLGIVDFRYEIPSYSLQPERSNNIEAGYKFSSHKLKGSLAIYYMHINNLITRLKKEGQFMSGYQVYLKENVEKAYIKGFETELLYQFSSSWYMLGSISNSYGQNLTRKEPLRRIPPFNGRFLTNYKINNISFSAEYLIASKQSRLAQGDKDDNRIPDGGTPGWQVLNIYGSYHVPFAQVNLGVQNIFNKDYRAHGSGINAVGRSAWMSVSVKF
ncbi:MAG: TonB-dependent receptor plug domain-containing protein [Chitinophagaceae bacterium]